MYIDDRYKTSGEHTRYRYDEEAGKEKVDSVTDDLSLTWFELAVGCRRRSPKIEGRIARMRYFPSL